MAIAPGKRPKAVIVTKDAVGQASVYLEQLPDKPKQNFSLREAVDQLRSQIQATLAKGYSYDDVAIMLKGKGIKISASTLKNYVPSGKRQTSKEKPAATRTRGRRSNQAQTDDLTTAEAAAPLTPTPPTVDEPAPTEAVEPAPAKRGRGRAKGATTAAAKSASSPKTAAETNAKPVKSRKPRSSSTTQSASAAGKESSTSAPRATRGRRKAT